MAKPFHANRKEGQSINFFTNGRDLTHNFETARLAAAGFEQSFRAGSAP
jgi:hypothetical protein